MRLSPRGHLLLASCRSGNDLATAVAATYADDGHLAATLLTDLDDKFSDGETIVRLRRDVSGNDVFLFQALFDPTAQRTIDENYMAFFIAARAFREWGANHVTAILPYLAYARQDQPAPYEYEPTTAKLTADLTLMAGIDRLITWHPHLRQVHGFYGGTPVHSLDALSLFAHLFRDFAGRKDVIAVAPDVGASKFITHFGRALNLSCAIASKYRPRPEEAVVNEIIGSVRSHSVAIVVDDMISSGGTIEALVKQLAREGIEEIYVGASHNLCQPVAIERLVALHEKYHLRRLVVTNTIPQIRDVLELPFVEVYDLASILGRAIARIHNNESLRDVYPFPTVEEV
jgi:ribose-phosphate pyrophosphokinase